MKAVYGFSVDDTTPDGTKRTLELAEFDNGTFGLSLETKWPDKDEPVITKLLLKPEGFNLLMELMSNAHNLRDYPVALGRKEQQ